MSRLVSQLTEAEKQFVERVGRLEERYKKDKYADAWLMPRELLIRMRDEIEKPELFERVTSR